MEDDAGMDELVEIIFRKKCTVQEKAVAHSSILSSLQTEDFSRKLSIVLYFKELIIIHRFKEYFDSQILRNILSSHEEYLKYLMTVCLVEYEENRNIFDSFIGVCALIKYVNKEILKKTGVNYLDLNSDIFMVFYRNVLKQSFLKRKSFSRFLVYIRAHKYIGWYCNRERFTAVDDRNNVFKFEYANKNIEEELRSRLCLQILPKDMETIKVAARSMAQEVISATSVELPVLPSEPDPIKRLVASRKKELAHEDERKRHFESAMTNRTSHGKSSLNPDAKINYFFKRQEDIARHEDIIQAVIKHNHSNGTSRENSNDQIFKDADRILEDLKSKIESLTKVLDECNKE